MARFIAGAVCPQCRAMDRIVVEEVRDAAAHGADERPSGAPVRRRRCVSCGYSDSLASGAAAEPATRFVQRVRDQSPARAVRIVDPGKDRR